MLRALSLPGLRVILLPGEPSFLPALIYSSNQILTEISVELLSPGLVGALLLSNVLVVVSLFFTQEIPSNLPVVA